MVFSKEYKNCPLDKSDGRLCLSYVESVGDDLESLLSNAMISLKTWHGEEGPDRDLGDLPPDIIEMITQDMSSALQDAADRRAEERAESQAVVLSLRGGK